MAHNHLVACPSLSSGVSQDCSCEKEEQHYLKLAKISFGLFIFELFGGYFSKSTALESDALHVLLDGTENILSALVSRFALKGNNEKKLRKIGGSISALLLLFAAGGIIYEGYERILNPHKVEWYMVIIAIIGLCVNLWQRGIHSEAPREHRNQTHFWQDWHLLSDISASIAVIVGGIIMLIAGKWYWIDGVLSVGIGVLITTFIVVKLLGVEIHSHDHEIGCTHKH